MPATPKVAIITGICGQDGYFLRKLLSSKGYQIHGIVRKAPQDAGINKFVPPLSADEEVKLHVIDLTDKYLVQQLFSRLNPDEIYHLAANSFIGQEIYGIRRVSQEVTIVENLLDFLVVNAPSTRLFFASSSEIFDSTCDGPHNALSKARPTSIYGISKLAGQNLVRLTREKHNVFAVSGILFNHESIRRPRWFLSRKISSTVSEIYRGRKHDLALGDLAVEKDWGSASEFVEAIWLMLQQQRAEDCVIGTGTLSSIKTIVEAAFSSVGLDYQRYIKYDESLDRGSTGRPRFADVAELRRVLGWEAKRSVLDEIKSMVKEDIG
jgi:GDPmannose 4,6-dehydratase